MTQNIIDKIKTYILDEYFIKNDRFRGYVSDRVNRIYYGMGFTKDRNNDTINQVFNSYRFYDIKKDDVVLDLGANIGAFSMFVSRNVNHVYAVEPVTTDILRKKYCIK